LLIGLNVFQFVLAVSNTADPCTVQSSSALDLITDYWEVPWRWKRYILPHRLWPPTRLHGFTTQNTNPHLKLLIMKFCPFSCSVECRNSSQHWTITMFHNHIKLQCFVFSVFRTREDEVINSMAALISGVYSAFNFITNIIRFTTVVPKYFRTDTHTSTRVLPISCTLCKKSILTIVEVCLAHAHWVSRRGNGVYYNGYVSRLDIAVRWFTLNGWKWSLLVGTFACRPTCAVICYGKTKKMYCLVF
jgi:hypothetical protein